MDEDCGLCDGTGLIDELDYEEQNFTLPPKSQTRSESKQRDREPRDSISSLDTQDDV